MLIRLVAKGVFILIIRFEMSKVIQVAALRGIWSVDDCLGRCLEVSR